MDIGYKTVAGFGSDEFIINKSRFIGHCTAVEDEEQAISFIQSVKEEHRNATHNVYAYITGVGGNLQRFSDDGEPSGTAGIPILEVIKKENLKHVAVVVTRYFGGIKLGGGGLVRAYTKGAKIALDSAVIVEMMPFEILKVQIGYTAFGKLENYLRDSGIEPDEIIFEDNVKLRISIPNKDIERFMADMNEMTSGSALIESAGGIYLPIKDGVRYMPVRGI
jgi:uncharacterized YigZ family protein